MNEEYSLEIEALHAKANYGNERGVLFLKRVYGLTHEVAQKLIDDIDDSHESLH